MDEFERWVADTFRRRGPDLVVGPIHHAVALHREQVDRLISRLAEMRDRLPTLDRRIAEGNTER